MTNVDGRDVKDIGSGYDTDPGRSMSLRAEAYLDPKWLDLEQRAVFARTWQWVCHVEKLRAPGSYVAATVAGMPVAVVRDSGGTLRAFYNVCKHRAHELLSGSGVTKSIVCPYHAWVYDLDGGLRRARKTDRMRGFDPGEIRLDRIRAEEFGGFVYVNLDPDAAPLAEQAPDLAAEIARWAPDVASLTFAKRLTYDIRSNWKNVIDNFLECYHCHVAHREFVALVDMDTYEVRTHGIWSSHFAEAGRADNPAYNVAGASVTQHAVWWLWPNTCLLRYPGRGNFMVLQVIPAGPDRTLETWDFYFETPELDGAEAEAVRYIDEVLQQQDIAIVESVQRGMATPAFDQGRIVYDPEAPGLSEHGVHHFHGLLLQAYEDFVLRR
ncbi:ring-hydroxylating oxygenase subunit alpha [Actinoplanes lobatus]|uniref:Choline monooxygenase n=1 Tax=Actinoplanes lobatus TaxID=113568 RepID=A0A7W7MIH2_9ACTN|nr:ring-hydroxylating oxygenase subunit alpha [Actinoplanes lobatus]MBB4750990.1 choline monooxygenase [Actinoplanes lobatus]GGN85886.1 ring-hydroxylating oxygenase subunit alpha [Actinoplanes lobatus]GIE43562.1 ring-hydroxylating oxygenase subunit alpha [Actinoplanes lobatus]